MENSQFTTNVVYESPMDDGLEIMTLKDFFAEPSFENTKPHIHSFYEIIWYREEGGIHSIDFREYDIKKNTIFFISPGQIHKFSTNQNQDGLLLKFGSDFLKKDDKEDLFVKYNIFSAHNSEPYCSIDESVAGQLNQIIDHINKEKENKELYGHLDMLRSLLNIFLVVVRRKCTKPGIMRLSELSPSHKMFVQFNQLLEENYHRIHTVQGYAELMGVSTKAISNCVKECANRPPLGYINERVMLEAMRMLKYTNVMIKDIGFALGFEDPSYFVKFFKHQTGMLPFKFRKNNK